MTALDHVIPMQAPQTSGTSIDPRLRLLKALFDVLDRDGLAYCVLHGYQTFDRHPPSDVHLLVPQEMLPRRLGELLQANAATLRARVLRWVEDRAHLVVLATAPASADEAPAILRLHVSADHVVHSRVIFSGSEVLATRRPAPDGGGFWVPAPQVEFGALLSNQVIARELDDAAARRLAELWTRDPIKCSEQVARLFGAAATEMICVAAGRDAWAAVGKHLPRLRREMKLRLALRRPISFAVRSSAQLARWIGRLVRPHPGLHLVFLGPDGVGKSTVIDAVRDRLAPAFCQARYDTFARGILPNRIKSSPHALPPRSLPASAIKAVWWFLCYVPGYYKSIFPTVARGGLMINHRYLLDALVDPKRYRYSGPAKWIETIWTIAPKPDLLLFLDAPAEVIQQRKREVPFEEAARQREAYLALAQALPNAVTIDTNQTIEKTIVDATDVVVNHLAARVSRQIRQS